MPVKIKSYRCPLVLPPLCFLIHITAVLNYSNVLVCEQDYKTLVAEQNLNHAGFMPSTVGNQTSGTDARHVDSLEIIQVAM